MFFQQHSALSIPKEHVVNQIGLNGPLVIQEPALAIGNNGVYNNYDENIHQHLKNCVSIVPDGIYKMSRGDIRYDKTRGEIQVGGEQYHVEIVWCTFVYYKEPLIIRMWNQNNRPPHQMEYLVSEVLIRLRNHLFGSLIHTNGLLFQMVDALLAYQEAPSSRIAAMFGWNFPSLIPNVSPEVHRDWLNEISPKLYSCQSNDDFILTLGESVFGPLGRPHEMNHFMGVLQGQVSSVELPSFRHPGTYCDLFGTSLVGTIDSVDHYFAIAALGLSVFDHYEVQVDIEAGELDIEELDTMSGVRTPVQYLKNDDLMQVVHRYLDNLRGNSAHHCYIVNDRRYHVGQVNIRRTMDERLVITLLMEDVAVNVPSDPIIVEQEYDLILLSILSPVLTLSMIEGIATPSQSASQEFSTAGQVLIPGVS